MKLQNIEIRNHPILKDLKLDFINPKTKEPYQIVVFVGENGCGKTTLLNELFRYSESEYIVSKQGRYDILPGLGFHPLFLRQNSLYTLSQNEIVKKINGDEGPFPIDSNKDLIGGKNVYGLRRSSKINTQSLGKDIVSMFNDDMILNAYLDNKIQGLKCGGEALKLIDGSQSAIDLTRLSSGQQEILLKMNVLQNIVVATDYVLFDEPETSLHPRWQKHIVRFFIEMVTGQEGETPQMFIATHSEKVLESLLEMEDILIIRFSKDRDAIKAVPIEQCNLFLPKTTFAELDYAIFNIPTFDYHDQLFTYFGDLLGSDSVGFIDKKILKNNLYKPELFKKWEGTKKVWNKITKQHELVPSFTATLPCYIRNYFHHPKKDLEPTEDELISSILFLQKLIQETKM